MTRTLSWFRMVYALLIGLFTHGATMASEADGEIRLIREGEHLIISDAFTVPASGHYSSSLVVSKSGVSGTLSSSQRRQIDAKAGQLCHGNNISMKVQTGDRIEAELIVRLNGTEVLSKERILFIPDDPETDTPDTQIPTL